MPATLFRFRRIRLTKHHTLMLAHCGVPAAIEVVVDGLRPRMAKMACFYARRSPCDADDLLQEAWIGLLEALPELDVTIGDPEQYLILRARWRVLDRIKHAWAREARVESVPFAEDETEDGLEAFTADDTEHVVAALCAAEFSARLKPRQRAILRCLMHGLTWRETGAQLGCTSANVAYHVRQIAGAYEAWDSGVP